MTSHLETHFWNHHSKSHASGIGSSWVLPGSLDMSGCAHRSCSATMVDFTAVNQPSCEIADMHTGIASPGENVACISLVFIPSFMADRLGFASLLLDRLKPKNTIE